VPQVLLVAAPVGISKKGISAKSRLPKQIAAKLCRPLRSFSLFYQLERRITDLGWRMHVSCDVSVKKLRWLKSMRRTSIFVATYALPFVLFMTPALINGFPLIYEVDSSPYLAHAILRDDEPIRPIYYCYFLFVLHWCDAVAPHRRTIRDDGRGSGHFL
jgi:hypothetical protein